MRMNTSLYFINLTEDEICRILEVVSVPYLMEPLKHQPEKYLAGRKNTQSLSREAVNHIYLQFLKSKDPVLSLYLSDIVVDIIHYFKLSDGFKALLTSNDPQIVDELKKKIKQRQCPITVDMFMRLLDRRPQKTAKPPKQEVPQPEEKKQTEVKSVPQKQQEQVIETKEKTPVDKPAPVYKEAKFFDIEDDDKPESLPESEQPVHLEPETVEKAETDVQDAVEEPKTVVEVVDNLPSAKETVEPVLEQAPEKEDSQAVILDLQYQIMNLQMENQTLREENRDLLFQTEDDGELDVLKREINGLKDEKERLDKDVRELSLQNTTLQNSLREFDDYKKKHNQVLLELRDYKIKYISAQAEMDQLRYAMKNDSKKLKELQNKQRSIYDNESDWMMAMHDLTWYKKQWQLPGDAPLHKIWTHLNREEAKCLAHLLKNYDRLLRTERKKEIDALKEILIVKEAILILLKSDKAMEQASQTKKA